MLRYHWQARVDESALQMERTRRECGPRRLNWLDWAQLISLIRNQLNKTWLTGSHLQFPAVFWRLELKYSYLRAVFDPFLGPGAFPRCFAISGGVICRYFRHTLVKIARASRTIILGRSRRLVASNSWYLSFRDDVVFTKKNNFRETHAREIGGFVLYATCIIDGSELTCRSNYYCNALQFVFVVLSHRQNLKPSKTSKTSIGEIEFRDAP